MTILKDLYKDYFRLGAACERIHEKNPNHEIGNPAKEKLLAEQFSSITFANELKPLYNMGFASPEATEEYLPFVINPAAKEMLDWVKKNGLSMRAHVLVWHSQCPKEIFCKGYEPVTFPTDPEILAKNPMMKSFEKLNPVCYVDRQTMLKRLESYIHSVMEYMYSNGYADIIYAWDVVNEAIELADKTPTGLRDSYWYQVIGDDFIYWAFRYAKDAVNACVEKYAASYGITEKTPENLKRITPSLIYNDYNEWQPEKKAAIIGALSRSTTEHGSILEEDLIDGIGMQGHLSDNNNVEEYLAALREYGGLVREVQVTELDVKSTCSNVNAEYYQAVFYKKLFEGFVEAVKSGIGLNSVTFWGLTDDNSWIRDANPLLFHGDLTPKKSFTALEYVITGESLGEPEQVINDLSDRNITFETGDSPEDLGFKFVGFGDICLQSDMVHSGTRALGNLRRFGDWCGVGLDVSDFIGQTIEFSAWVCCGGRQVTVDLTCGDAQRFLTAVDCREGEWVLLSARAQIPVGLHASALLFRVKEDAGNTNPLYIDDVMVKLIGLEESFEGERHIASIRGAGHLPLLQVVDTESRDGRSHSLRVTRQEKDATVKLDVSSYIGQSIVIRTYVKTRDAVVRMGLDGAVPLQLAEVAGDVNGWREICAEADLPREWKAAQIYIETDGRNDFYVDDVFVTLSDNG